MFDDLLPTIGATEESERRNFFRVAKTIQLVRNITDIQVAGDSARTTARFAALPQS